MLICVLRLTPNFGNTRFSCSRKRQKECNVMQVSDLALICRGGGPEVAPHSTAYFVSQELGSQIKINDLSSKTTRCGSS